MSALPGGPGRRSGSALFPCLCGLLDKEPHRRLCPWEAAQPDLLAAKEFIDCVGFAVARQCILVERDDTTGRNQRIEVPQAGECAFVIIEIEIEQRDPRAQLTASVFARGRGDVTCNQLQALEAPGLAIGDEDLLRSPSLGMGLQALLVDGIAEFEVTRCLEKIERNYALLGIRFEQT